MSANLDQQFGELQGLVEKAMRLVQEEETGQSTRIAELEREKTHLQAALDAEQKAHDEIASLCFMNGVETCDGTSVGAVQGLVDALKTASAHEAELEQQLAEARGALKELVYTFQSYETHGEGCAKLANEKDACTCGADNAIEQARRALAGQPASGEYLEHLREAK